jgi:hypothetical protein
MPWSNKDKSCMRVEKREFAWEFSQLYCPGQTRTRVAWELRSESLHESWEARVCMRVFSTLLPRSNENKSFVRVDKREFASEFSQFSCPGQMRTRVAWELRSKSLDESFFNSIAPIKREQEFRESWQDITARVAKSLVKFWTSSKLMRMHDRQWKLAVKREQSHPCLSRAWIFVLVLHHTHQIRN